MIKTLHHKDIIIAKQIYHLFQVSYAVEAKLLNAPDFPPLKRKVVDFLDSNTSFFGFWEKENLAGVIEIDSDNSLTHIQSLVVDPDYFRRGIASQLIRFTFENFDSNGFSVETGLDNQPAILLYKRLGFQEMKVWDTDHGVRKIRFIRGQDPK